MAKIAVLDENMINMIAAGEVIERPASVVKELLENSIDAGAEKIVIRIEDGGKRLISIVDDGFGMDAEDVGTAFLPHATSKIKQFDDLNTISTMGFRGEALASIASVSDLSVVSRTGDSIQANRLEIDCGVKQPVKPCSGDTGTTIEVRNLFYKLPARRKFLRTASTEVTHINECFGRIALANPQIDLTLVNNGKVVHRLLKSSSLRERVSQLAGKSISEDLLETESSEKGINIYALLGKANAARATGKFQYIFLNGRFIRDKFILHAIKEAYRGLIEPNKYPVVYLFLTLPYDSYDVNVHPTKVEVRFENSNLIHSQVLAVLREKLLSTDMDVSASLSGGTLNISAPAGAVGDEQSRQARIARAMQDFFTESSPGNRPQQQFSFSGTKQTTNFDTSRPFNDDVPVPSGEYEAAGTKDNPAVNAKHLQLHNSYIVTQTEEGFAIVDQHALHERIIYERLCERIANGNLSSQRMLIPETVSVSDQQLEALESNRALVEKLEIELEPFGPGTLAVQSFPAILDKVCPAEFVQDMLDMLSDKTVTVDAEKLLGDILDMAACKAAIKAGNSLTQGEIDQLLADKDAIERASRCPHGRPTTLKFSLAELEKQFKRTGF